VGERARVCAEVVDAGIGIPPEAYEKLFHELFRAPNARQTAGRRQETVLVRDLVRRGGAGRGPGVGEKGRFEYDGARDSWSGLLRADDKGG